MDTNIFHSNNSIIPILILWVISKLIAQQSPCSQKCYFFANGSYFNFNSKLAYPALALHHNLQDLPPTHSNTSCQHSTSLYLLFLLPTVVVIMVKEQCHGCNKWFARIEQHLTYHNHCWSVMMEHAHQQRLDIQHCNCNDGLDPLIGTIVVASFTEIDDCMFIGMSSRHAKRHQCINQEEDNQSNVTLEGIDVVGNFGPTITSPPGGIDALEADLHAFQGVHLGGS
jgi:hypothetical protein